MRLPSEWNLVETFSISRTTVRIALQELEDEGLISRKRGLGTFVREDAGSILKPRKQEVKLRVSFVLHNNQAGNFFFRDVIGFFRESADESIQIRVFFQNYLKPEIYAKAGSDVLIIENGAFGDDIVYELNDFAGRTILLNGYSKTGNFVCTNNFLGGKMMAEYAAAAGHRRIGVLSYSSSTDAPEFEERLKGIIAGLGESGLEPPRISKIPLHERYGMTVNKALERLVGGSSGVTAIIVCEDAFARRVYEFAEARGISIPDDLSVMGYDGMPLGGYLYPPLTTVRQPLQEIGKELALAINNYAKGERLVIRKLLSPSLIERQSFRRI
jgi:DNA-binding LacI/PurR family transcriptional regulator